MLREIKAKVAGGQYEYSKHAVDQSIIRRISEKEVVQAVFSCNEIIEDYPDDKYEPSCLILGFTGEGRPLHIQCTHPSRRLLKIVTVYEPNGDLWINFRVRKPKQKE